MQSYALENGARLHVVRAARGARGGAARGAARRARSPRRRETPGIGSFLASMWLRGTRGRSAADLAREIEGLAADLDGFSGRNSAGLTLEVTSDRLRARARSASPRRCSSPPSRPRRSRRSATRRSPPSSAARTSSARASSTCSRETHYRTHPYGLPIARHARRPWRRSTARRCSRTTRALVDPRHLVVALVGDVDPDDAAAELAQAARRACAAPDAPPWSPPPAEAAARASRATRSCARIAPRRTS